MPAAPADRRPGAASPDARRPAADPWAVELRELGRRPGSMQELDRTIPAPEGWRLEMIGVPQGAPVHLRLRLESVMEGVLVSGDVEVRVEGQCARCLDPVEDTYDLDVQELFAYPGSATEATSEEDEVRLVEGERIDLQPMVRDAVVLALPLSPTCSEDCAGLCSGCGQRLDDLPDDHSHELVDPRWAGLAGRFTTGAVTDRPGDPEEN
ncbi:YceD family protein [Geodermatophilus sp. SYSU D01180]